MNRRRNFGYWPPLIAISAVMAVLLLGDYIDGLSGELMGVIGLIVGYVIGQVHCLRGDATKKGT